MRYHFGLLLLIFALASCSSAKKTVRNNTTVQESKVVRVAKSYIGKPYKYGGVGPKNFDCSGFTSYVYRQTGKTIPRTTKEQATFGKTIRQGELRAGDLVFFKKNKGGKQINHVALVEKVGPGIIQVIHSTSSRGVLSENILQSTYWKERILFFRRVS